MAPRVPKEIPEGRWRDLWSECLDVMDEPGRVEAKLLERMLLNLVAAEFSLAEAIKQPMVEGSQGQEVENAHYKVAARCDSQALSIARQLQLTPQARANVSIPPEEPAELDPVEAARADELAQRRAQKAS